MISSSIQRIVVATFAGVTVLTAPSVVRTQPVQCIPPKNCKTEAQCCAFKNDGLLRFQMVSTRKMRDWFGDPCNVTPYETMSDGLQAWKTAADNADKSATQSTATAARMTPAEIAMHNNNPISGTTDPITCKTKYPPNMDNASTCKEIIDGVKVHEGEHRDFCDMLNNIGSARAKWGPADRVKAMAESERRAHALEYVTLLREYEGARRRCLSAQNKLTPELEQKSKNLVKKADDSYLKGGGGTCAH